MTITLRIDNLDVLPDGGPLEYRSAGRGLTIGRGETCDWSLPDPSRFVSGRHCEVRYEGGTYWLSDVSTNGTFLNGARQRMKSPHRLVTGDRVGIGHYVVSVSVEPLADAFHDAPDVGAPGPSPAEDIWGSAGPVPAPIDRRDLLPARQRGQRAADFSQEFLVSPFAAPSGGGGGGGAGFGAVQAGSRGEVFPMTENGAAVEAMPKPGPVPVPTDASHPSIAAERPGTSFFADYESDKGQPARTPATGDAAAPYLPYPGSTAGGDAEFLRRFALGAGIDPFVLSTSDPGDTAEEIGRIMRIVIDEVQQLLKARQAAKVLAKSSKRTMLGRINNPLKFLPNPEEVLEVLFTGRRSGYLAAVEAFEEAFGDLKRHEMATYAAMQSALSRLLQDLSPEAIEGKVSGSAFASRKSRNWEMYVTRWEAKTEPYENGMLDVFLAYFAEAYDEGQRGL